jgi:uncharacterized OB-fold protein
VSTLEPAEARDTDLFTPADPGEPTALCASSCPSCGRVAFPRRSHCPACGAASAPAALHGPARLRVLTAVLAQPPGSRVEPPYEVGVAEFDEGICVIGLMNGTAQRGDAVVPVVVEPYPQGRFFAFRRVP